MGIGYGSNAQHGELHVVGPHRSSSPAVEKSGFQDCKTRASIPRLPRWCWCLFHWGGRGEGGGYIEGINGGGGLRWRWDVLMSGGGQLRWRRQEE